jgi:hypothetical protein
VVILQTYDTTTMSIEEIRKFLREHGLEAVPASGPTTGTLADFLSWSPENTTPISFLGGDFPGGITAISAQSHQSTDIKFSDAFSACTTVDLSTSQVQNLVVPASCTHLILDGCGSSDPLNCVFPAGLQELSLVEALFSALPDLPAGLQVLNMEVCGNLSALPALPAGLRELYATSSALAALPALSGTALQILEVANCGVSALPTLPATLTRLGIDANGIASVPTIPVATTDVSAGSCGWNAAKVDSLLAQLVANGQSNGTVNISGNALPSAAGVTSKNTLISRGWTVMT